jgi:two-component system phosphate regulon sensor histidine kinase PhoR
MKRSSIWIIIGLMTIALAGIISLQANWIISTIHLNEERFDKNVFAAIFHLAERMESQESMAALESMNGFESNFLEQEIRQVLQTGSPNLPDLSADQFLDEELPNDRLAAILLNQNSCDCASCRLDRQVKYYQIMRKRLQRSEYSLPERIGDLTVLQTMLQEELENAGISTPFHFGIFSNESNSFIINDGHYVVQDLNEQVSQIGGFDELLNSKYRVSLFPEGKKVPGFLMIYFPGKVTAVWGSVLRNLVGSVLFTGIILFCFAYTIMIIFRQKKVSEMKNDFINNMTHEFKTPIATISLAADSISSPMISGDSTKVRRFADIIRQENRRMNNQVEKVLQMALIEKQDYMLNLGPVNLHDVILAAVNNFALQIEQREGKITTDLAASNPIIQGDQTHIASMIHNLLDNANKYSPEKPEILISTRMRPKGVEIAIRDHGLGISKEARKHIFEKFYRVHTGNLHDVKGFGLGLSYVKAMMDAHHGQVEVESEQGKGSNFILFFPFKPEMA